MFGHYFRNIDDKNRIAIPPKFREELGKICYATIGSDQVLAIRSKANFENFKDKLLSQNMLDPNARLLVRTFLANTFEIEFDSNGRINLPSPFISRLKINKEIAFLGLGDKVEVWAKEKFDEFQVASENLESLASIEAELMKSGAKL